MKNTQVFLLILIMVLVGILLSSCTYSVRLEDCTCDECDKLCKTTSPAFEGDNLLSKYKTPTQ